MSKQPETLRVIYTSKKGKVYLPATVIDTRTFPGGRTEYHLWWEQFEAGTGKPITKWVNALCCKPDESFQSKFKKADRENTWFKRLLKLLGFNSSETK